MNEANSDKHARAVFSPMPWLRWTGGSKNRCCRGIIQALRPVPVRIPPCRLNEMRHIRQRGLANGDWLPFSRRALKIEIKLAAACRCCAAIQLHR
jgi:hypothetical protein